MNNKNKAQLTPIVSTVAIPDFPKSGRGGKPTYDFDGLKVKESFGVKNRSAKALASTVSTANKRERIPDLDKAGKPLFNEIKDDTGKVINKTPKMKAGKVFKAMDVDPKIDPDGAICRIWRIA